MQGDSGRAGAGSILFGNPVPGLRFRLTLGLGLWDRRHCVRFRPLTRRAGDGNSQGVHREGTDGEGSKQIEAVVRNDCTRPEAEVVEADERNWSERRTFYTFSKTVQWGEKGWSIKHAAQTAH